MKPIVIAALLAAATSTAHAQELGLEEVHGVVESVREVPLRRYPAGLAEVFEHAINPETAQEVIVRLADERAIAVVQDGPQRYEPGERVLVARDGNGHLFSTTSN